VRRLLTLCWMKGWNLSPVEMVSWLARVVECYLEGGDKLLIRWTRMVRLWTVTLSPHIRSSGGQVGRSMALVTNLATSRGWIGQRDILLYHLGCAVVTYLGRMSCK
jgi:hypothetical protein